MAVVEERRSFLQNKSVLQVANNETDALSNKTLLELASGDFPEYFAPFILKISCRHSDLFDYTVDTLADVFNRSLENTTFFTLIQEVLSIKEFLMIKIGARKIQREEVIELSKIYGITLDFLAERQRTPIKKILSMTLMKINSLFCFASLSHYAQNNGKSLKDVAKMINVTEQQLKHFDVCRKVLPNIIHEKVTDLLGYPPTTTDALLSCSLRPVSKVNFVDKCKLLKNRSLAFVLINYDKLSLPLHKKSIFQIHALLDGSNACGKRVFTPTERNKLKE